MSGITISEAFELYRVEYIVFRNQSSKTEEMSITTMNSLISFAGDIPVQTLSFDTIRKWKVHLSKNKSQNTVRGYIIKLRVVLAYLKLKNIDVLDPNIIGVPKRINKPVKFLTPDEVSDLLTCVFKPQAGYSTHNRYRNRAIISLLYASGIRVSELCSLDTLHIQKDGTFSVMGKGNKSRLCFLDDRAATYLKEYLNIRHDSSPALFISEHTGDRISKNTVEEIFRNAKRKAGFDKDIYPHIMRHSFATDLLRNNTNLLYVRDFLGHTSIQTTEMYTHVVNEDLRRIHKHNHTY